MTFYSRLQDTADRILRDKGRALVLVREATAFDPATGVNTTTETTYDVVGAVLPASQGTIQAFDNRLQSGTLIDEKLRYIILSARDADGNQLAITPKSSDTMRFDGADWFVLGSTPVAPAGTPVYFKIGCQLVE